ncbi:unnamed protein product [Pedinophyceae sp. YPF-701]|nr:unnamed protein product [Pedinophyceae sp. YPF-701]
MASLRSRPKRSRVDEILNSTDGPLDSQEQQEVVQSLLDECADTAALWRYVLACFSGPLAVLLFYLAARQVAAPWSTKTAAAFLGRRFPAPVIALFIAASGVASLLLSGGLVGAALGARRRRRSRGAADNRRPPDATLLAPRLLRMLLAASSAAGALCLLALALSEASPRHKASSAWVAVGPPGLAWAVWYASKQQQIMIDDVLKLRGAMYRFKRV